MAAPTRSIVPYADVVAPLSYLMTPSGCTPQGQIPAGAILGARPAAPGSQLIFDPSGGLQAQCVTRKTNFCPLAYKCSTGSRLDGKKMETQADYAYALVRLSAAEATAAGGKPTPDQPFDLPDGARCVAQPQPAGGDRPFACVVPLSSPSFQPQGYAIGTQ